MMFLLYLLIALAATTIGAMTGMGGGVIIKPVLDAFGQFDAASISMLSTLTVLAMSAISVIRQRTAPERPRTALALPLAAGSVIGGLIGGALLTAVITASGGGKTVTLAQNIILALLIVLVIVYIRVKSNSKGLGLTGILPACAAGLAMGFLGAFLGIGGGPINVAIIVFAFSLTTKQAAQYSLVTILFSQAAKALAAAFSGGFSGYDLRMLPVMVVGAIAGGFLGAMILKRVSEKTADLLFSLTQIGVLALCVLNITRNL